MTYHQLDAIFPYVCFCYGVVMTVTLNLPALARIADERLPQPILTQWRAHGGFALVCLFVGAAWILQNLWVA